MVLIPLLTHVTEVAASLQVQLRDDESEADGKAVADDLRSKLGVAESDLVIGAYMDLLLKKEGK